MSPLLPPPRFWLGFALPLLALGLLIDALAVFLNIEGRWLRPTALALLLSWLGLVAVATAGAWRLRRAALPERIALLFLGVGAWALAVAFCVPQLGRWASLVWGVDPLGPTQVQVAPDGRSLRLQGEARAAGAPDDAVQIAAQQTVAQQLPTLLRQAGATLQAQYLELLEAQLSSAPDPACNAVLAGEVAARRALPVPLVLRESIWLLSAAAEPAGAAPRPPTRIELEVLRRALGADRAPALLAALRRPSAPQDCERALRLIRAVQQLAPAERRLATRIALEAP